MLAQAEVTLLYPLFCQVPRPVLRHSHGSAVEVPITHPSGSPRFEEPTKLFRLPSYLSPPPSSANDKRATPAAGGSQTTTPSRRHTGREHRAHPALRMSLLHRASAPPPMPGQAGIPKSLVARVPAEVGASNAIHLPFPRSYGTNLKFAFNIWGPQRGSRGCDQAGRADQIAKHFIQRILSPSPASGVSYLQGA